VFYTLCVYVELDCLDDIKFLEEKVRAFLHFRNGRKGK
jgi:hypothetical protein